MKAHIGVDSATGLIHSASLTAANEHDSQQLGNLTSTATKPGFIATAPTGISRTRSKPNRPRLKTSPTSALTVTHRLASGTKRRKYHRKPGRCQGRASVCHAQAHLGLCQGAVSGAGQECKPYVCHAGVVQYRQAAQAVGGYQAIGAPEALGELRNWLKSGTTQIGKQAKFMKHQSQNTEIEFNLRAT